MMIMLKDGIYRVETAYLCAGFVIQNGRIVQCAPILRKRLSYWITQAYLIPKMVEEH